MSIKAYGGAGNMPAPVSDPLSNVSLPATPAAPPPLAADPAASTFASQSPVMAMMGNPYNAGLVAQQQAMYQGMPSMPLSAMYNPMLGQLQFNPFSPEGAPQLGGVQAPGAAAAGGMYGAGGALGAGAAGKPGVFDGGFNMGEKLPKKMGDCNKFMKKFIKDHKSELKGMSNDEKKAIAALAWDVEQGNKMGAPGMYATFSMDSMKGPLQKLMKNSDKLPAEFSQYLQLGQQRLAGTDPLSQFKAMGGAAGAGMY